MRLKRVKDLPLPLNATAGRTRRGTSKPIVDAFFKHRCRVLESFERFWMHAQMRGHGGRINPRRFHCFPPFLLTYLLLLPPR